MVPSGSNFLPHLDQQFGQMYFDLQQTLSTEESGGPVRLVDGVFVLAKHSDGLWHRAQVLDSNRVRLVDYGDEITVGHNCIRPLPPRFKSLPAFAIKCSLKGCVQQSLQVLNNCISTFAPDQAVFYTPQHNLYPIELSSTKPVSINAMHMLSSAALAPSFMSPEPLAIIHEACVAWKHLTSSRVDYFQTVADALDLWKPWTKAHGMEITTEQEIPELPNEVMCKVFKLLPSTLSVKFTLAAVNHKFRVNILRMLKKEPMRLEMNDEDQTINGIKLPSSQWPAALMVLSKRTKFYDIQIIGGWHQAALDRILNILVYIKAPTQLVFFELDVSCISHVLAQFLEKCTALVFLDLNLPLSRLPVPNASAVDLMSTLNNKALIWFGLVLDEYPLEELITSFRSLQPNTLKYCRIETHCSLDLVQLMRRLPDNLWAVLKTFDFDVRASNDAQLELLGLVARLPKLSCCSIIYYDANEQGNVIIPFDQLTDGVMSSFNDQTWSNPFFLKYLDFRLKTITGCAITHLVRTLQHRHPQMQFNFGEGMSLDFTLGNFTFSIGDHFARYCAQGCGECQSFYPTVLYSLVALAAATQDNGHLYNHHLDRCKVGRIVDDFNRDGDGLHSLTALSAVVSEAQDSATVTLETDGGDQFYITSGVWLCNGNKTID